MTCGEWGQLPVRLRIRCVCPLRHLLASNTQEFVDSIQLPFRQSSLETITAEIIPLADACKFLERSTSRLLRPRRLGSRGRPAWLIGARAEVRRVPLGTVLIIGPGNYPLMLPGVQIVQALVAGNRVIFKPAPGTAKVAALLHESLRSIGLPDGVFTVIDESPRSLEPWWTRVDKVIVTGSESTGRAVMLKCAEHLIPSTMELSGCDAVLVLPGANLQRVVRCISFGVNLNGGRSCIAPRRVLAHRSIAASLRGALVDAGIELCEIDPTNDAFGIAAIQFVESEDEAAMIAEVARCPLRLGASVFGPKDAATALARELPVGSVVVNDLIVPTADPRLPFGGTGRSGFGVTRGAEGLLEMTRPQVISLRRGGILFHLRPTQSRDETILRGQLSLTHGRKWRDRGRGFIRMIKAVKS